MRFVRRILPSVLLVLLVASGVVLWFRQNEIFDWLATRGYEPTAAVASMVTDTTMTPYAKQLFYANRPDIENKQEFNQHCTDPSDQVAVLGCYTGNRRGIYIYAVTDERLSGIEQVTAAHEMLHQAYQRLDKAEKNRVNGLLQEYFDLKADQKIKDKINSYKESEPDQLQNEMHSIFGTEIRDLSPELEQYYKQYFANREQILALHDKYQSEFDKRIAQINSYDAQLSELKAKIEANKKQIESLEKQLRQERAQMDSYLESNRIAEYNAAVPGFNAQVVVYRDLVDETNGLIDQFNAILATRNALAIQERQLENAVDSSLQSAPRQ
jgi:chromosome segregation ATPase